MNTNSKTDKTASASQNVRKVVQLDKQGPYAWGVQRDGKLIAQGLSKVAAEALAKPQGKPELPTTQQAQHSPLPWHVELTRHISYRREEANGNVEIGGVASCERRGEYGAADAKLIVASVNHAEALAEALAEVIATGHDHNETGGVLITHEAWQACKDALANWEGVQQ